MRTAGFVFLGTVVMTATSLRASEPSRSSFDVAPLSVTHPPGTVDSAGTTAPRKTVSPETAAKFTAAVPKFVPKPVPETAAAPAPEPLPDLRETDKPKNTIIRLPPYMVSEKKVVKVPTELEVQSPSMRRDVALRRYPGLKIGNFFGLNERWAYAMMAEEERLVKKREYEDMVSLTRFGDPAEHKEVKQQVESAFQREPDFGR